MKILLTLIILAGLALILPVAAEQANPGDAAKAIVVHLNIKNDTITYRDSEVVFGYPPDNIANRDFGVDLLGNGATLASLGIEDPRLLYTEDGAVLEDDLDFAVIVPLVEGVQAVRVTDGATNATLITVDVEPAIAQFYTQYPQARGGVAAETVASPAEMPLSPLGTIAALLIVLVVVTWSRRAD